MREAWGEIDDLDDVAEPVRHRRREDGGVLEIGLFAAFHADLIDGEDTPLIRIRAIGGTIDKAEENRVAVEIAESSPR